MVLKSQASELTSAISLKWVTSLSEMGMTLVIQFLNHCDNCNCPQIGRNIVIFICQCLLEFRESTFLALVKDTYISYFSIFMLKYHDEEHLEEKRFREDYVPRDSLL